MKNENCLFLAFLLEKKNEKQQNYPLDFKKHILSPLPIVS
jgi:hypothetical protein